MKKTSKIISILLVFVIVMFPLTIFSQNNDIKTGRTGGGNFTYYSDTKKLVIDAWCKFIPEFACYSDMGFDCGYTFESNDELLTSEEIKGIKSICINEGVTLISTDPFSYCDNLEEVILPKSLKRILVGTFYDTKNLKVINYAGTEKEWESIKIDRDNDCLSNAKINYNVDVPKSQFYSNLNSDIETERKYANGNIYATLNYYTGVVSIDGKGKLSFSNDNEELSDTNIDSLFIEQIGDGIVFPYVDEIIISDGITEIGESVFRNTSATKITIPKTVKVIKKDAFAVSKKGNLQTIIYNSTKEDWEKIEISQQGNENLLNANIVFLSKAENKKNNDLHYAVVIIIALAFACIIVLVIRKSITKKNSRQ